MSVQFQDIYRLAKNKKSMDLRILAQGGKRALEIPLRRNLQDW